MTDNNLPNNIFSPQRFGQYFNLYITSWWRMLASVYGGLLLAYIGLTLFVLLITGSSMYGAERMPGWSYSVDDLSYDEFWRAEGVVAVLMSFLFAVITGGMMFISMRNKESRLRTLIAPASTLEKFATVFVLYIAVAYIMYFVSMVVADLVRIGAVHLFYEHAEYARVLPWYNPMHLAQVWTTSPVPYAMFLSNAISLQVLFALGSIVWYRNSIIKTAVFAYALSVATSVIAMISIGVMAAHAADVFTAEQYSLRDFHGPNEWGLSAFIFFGTLIVSTGLYILTYFRFKESSLNFRW